MDVQSSGERKNSAAYWKAKFDGPQQFMRQLSEKSPQLEEILGLLTVQRVSIELSQVRGSMTGKNVLQIIQSMKDKK